MLLQSWLWLGNDRICDHRPLIFLCCNLMGLCQKYRERKRLWRAFLVVQVFSEITREQSWKTQSLKKRPHGRINLSRLWKVVPDRGLKEWGRWVSTFLGTCLGKICVGRGYTKADMVKELVFIQTCSHRPDYCGVAQSTKIRKTKRQKGGRFYTQPIFFQHFIILPIWQVILSETFFICSHLRKLFSWFQPQLYLVAR